MYIYLISTIFMCICRYAKFFIITSQQFAEESGTQKQVILIIIQYGVIQVILITIQYSVIQVILIIIQLTIVQVIIILEHGTTIHSFDIKYRVFHSNWTLASVKNIMENEDIVIKFSNNLTLLCVKCDNFKTNGINSHYPCPNSYSTLHILESMVSMSLMA